MYISDKYKEELTRHVGKTCPSCGTTMLETNFVGPNDNLFVICMDCHSDYYGNKEVLEDVRTNKISLLEGIKQAHEKVENNP